MRLLNFILLSFFLIFITSCTQEVPKGTVRIDTVPTDVPLTIDGNYVGNSSAGVGQYFAIELTEGEHVISSLVDVNNEKQLVAEKSVFVAPNTLQTLTLNLEERLTPLGVTEKARREFEAEETKRKADMERERQLKLEEQNRKKVLKDNRASVEYLNNLSFSLRIEQQTFDIGYCNIKKRSRFLDGSPTYFISARAKNLDADKTKRDLKYTKGYPGERFVYEIGCKGDNKCISRTDTDRKFNSEHIFVVDNEEIEAKKASQAIKTIIQNCQ